VINWLKSNSPAGKMRDWLTSGFSIDDAKVLSRTMSSVPKVDRVERYRSAGIPIGEIGMWLNRGIGSRQAARYFQAGYDARMASSLIEVGLGVRDARFVDLSYPIEGPPELNVRGRSFDPASGWSPNDLEGLSAYHLSKILEMDLRTVPRGTSPEDLQQQILDEQEIHRRRGRLEWFVDEQGRVILYEPKRAQMVGAVIECLYDIGEWGDVVRLSKERGSVAREAFGVIAGWHHWLKISDEDLRLLEDAGITHELFLDTPLGDLLSKIPEDTPVEFVQRDDTGEPLVYNPFDPIDLGVPRLIDERYPSNPDAWCGGPVGIARNLLPFVRKTARAIGWSVATTPNDWNPHSHY
jgi:hypothetical protein